MLHSEHGQRFPAKCHRVNNLDFVARVVFGIATVCQCSMTVAMENR